jgi:hypothetical protein
MILMRTHEPKHACTHAHTHPCTHMNNIAHVHSQIMSIYSTKNRLLSSALSNVCVFHTGRAGFPDFAKLMCNYSLPLTTPTPSSHASDASTAAFVAIAVAVAVSCLLLLCLVMLVLKSVRGAPRARPLVCINWFSNEFMQCLPSYCNVVCFFCVEICI